MSAGTFKAVVLIAIWLPVLFGAGAFLDEDPSEAMTMLVLGIGISLFILRLKVPEDGTCAGCGKARELCECVVCENCCGDCCDCCACDCHDDKEEDDG